jgi:hypothetical protein
MSASLRSDLEPTYSPAPMTGMDCPLKPERSALFTGIRNNRRPRTICGLPGIYSS